MKVNIIDNIKGSFGMLNDDEYLNFVESTNLLCNEMYKLKDLFSKPASEIDFQFDCDDILEGLDNFLQAVDYDIAKHVFNRIKYMSVKCEVNIFYILSSLNNIVDCGSEEYVSTGEYFMDIAKEHCEEWSDLNKKEYESLKNACFSAIRALNLYNSHSYYFYDEDNEEYKVERTFDAYLKKNHLTVEEYKKRCDMISSEYPPDYNDMLSNPDVTKKFLEKVSDEYVSAIQEYVDVITLEDMTHVIEDKIVVNDDFIEMLSNRGEY